jgi:hypothetical protein
MSLEDARLPAYAPDRLTVPAPVVGARQLHGERQTGDSRPVRFTTGPQGLALALNQRKDGGA